MFKFKKFFFLCVNFIIKTLKTLKMYSLEQLLEICEKKIQEFKFDREPRLLYEPIEYTLAAGGKRLRYHGT